MKLLYTVSALIISLYIFNCGSINDSGDKGLDGTWVADDATEVFGFHDSLISHVIQVDIQDVGTGYLKRSDEKYFSISHDTITSKNSLLQEVGKYIFELLLPDTLLIQGTMEEADSTTRFFRDTSGSWENLLSL